jgi:hypothetical protein
MGLRRSPLLFLLVLPPLVLAQPKPPFRDKEAALKLFASEFVAITPGKGKSSAGGSASIRRMALPTCHHPDRSPRAVATATIHWPRSICPTPIASAR